MQVCVIYLAWGPLGSEPPARFARSYLQHPAGIPHRLVIACKGQQEMDAAPGSLVSLARELGAQTVGVPDRGLDLDSYAAVARQLPDEAFCFLNTSSEILAAGWLETLSRALALPQMALVGATGSWESALSEAPRPLKPVLRRRYPPFPNPHIRTNAFMLRAGTLHSLHWPPVLRKSRALALESGRLGITRQIAQRGLRYAVAGRDGEVHLPDGWPRSRTFRSGHQENLLVADNRTRQYAAADARERARLATFAWGPAAAARLSPPLAPAQRPQPGA